MDKDFIISQVRTWIPIAVGYLLSYLATKGIVIDQQIQAALITLIGGLATGLYYFIARLLEVHVSPKFGWLLGYAKKPEYVVDPNKN